MSYRPLGQFPQYFRDDGTPNAGGWLYFYENDLTTPKNTYSDPGLSIANPNPLQLTAEGYPLSDVWGDGVYGVELADSDNVVYRTFNQIRQDTTAVTIPALVNGAFLTNDGSNLLWEQIRQLLLPDADGLDGMIPIASGGAWVTTPFDIEIPDPEIVISQTNKSFRAGISDSPTKFLLQCGKDTMPANPGGVSSLKEVTYPEAFTTIWGAVAIAIGAPQPQGPTVLYTQGEAGLASVTFVGDVAEGNNTSPSFPQPQPFYWIAAGTKTVA